MKKHRGQNRILKNIESSIQNESHLDIDFLSLEGYFNFQTEDCYGDRIATKGKSRKIIIKHLFDIYFKWKTELQNLNKPFYLAIWLYEPRLLKSEIVCAIGDKISYYQNDAFMQSNKISELDPKHYGRFANLFEKFSWSRKIDLEPYNETEINWPKEQYHFMREYKSDKKFFKKLIAEEFHVIENDYGKLYFNPEGDIWIGQEI